MSPEKRRARLADEIEADLASVARLADSMRSLMAAVRGRDPSEMEVAAAAAILHAFYNGVENSLRRIAATMGDPPRSPGWHSALLDDAAEDRSGRGPVLTAALVDRLRGYMQFRHFFRHA